jgi:hypothetical protein
MGSKPFEQNKIYVYKTKPIDISNFLEKFKYQTVERRPDPEIAFFFKDHKIVINEFESLLYLHSKDLNKRFHNQGSSHDNQTWNAFLRR